ncbi:cAMP-dependent protein kinase type II regulatory subunit-like isoform X1 [Haliotis asinina]|uniref:cAMP-dependent protein kinase type II regulatory subunit-like isoform X1 n=1 Tax=Haliotis asinina TaxID=109174 RepID=UPI0035324D73
MMNFEIPVGLTDLLQEFTVAVLREKPSPADLVQFAADYFNKLNDCKNVDKINEKRGVRFVQSPVPNQSDEHMQTDEEDEDDEPMEPPPMSRFQRRKSVSAEGYDPEADDDNSEEKIVYPKSDEQRQRLSKAVEHILLFRSLEQEQMQEVLDAMFEKKVEPEEHVIDQHDDGDNFYVIDSGLYDIYVEIDGKPKKVGSYDNQGSFGELALMYNMPRAATIIATTPGTLWAMDRVTFRRIVLKNAYNKRKMYESLIESVPLLKSLESYERMNVADALHSKTFEDGSLIIKQGDDADCMYFIEEGEVRIAALNKDDSIESDTPLESDENGKEIELTRCRKGDYFGELALVTHKPRAASAYSVGKTKCAVLDVGAFERLLGPCMDVMKRNIDNYEEQLVSVFGSKTNISDLR